MPKPPPSPAAAAASVAQADAPAAAATNATQPQRDGQPPALAPLQLPARALALSSDKQHAPAAPQQIPQQHGAAQRQLDGAAYCLFSNAASPLEQALAATAAAARPGSPRTPALAQDTQLWRGLGSLSSGGATTPGSLSATAFLRRTSSSGSTASPLALPAATVFTVPSYSQVPLPSACGPVQWWQGGAAALPYLATSLAHGGLPAGAVSGWVSLPQPHEQGWDQPPPAVWTTLVEDLLSDGA